MLSQDILSYYNAQSPLTDPGPYASWLDDLPAEPHTLAQAVQNVLLHRLSAHEQGVELSSGQRAEKYLRTVEQRLQGISLIDDVSLTQPREPSQRQVGVCRDFAILHVALLRHTGIPARMRVGFAKYLDPEGPLWIDHWVSEYWNAEVGCWMLTDPEFDAAWREKMEIEADFGALRLGIDFTLAGAAWQQVREGKTRSDLFRYNQQWKGMRCIRGNLLHDFQALNKIELGVFDYWDELATKADTSLTPEDKGLLDRIARLTLSPDESFDELHELFASLPRTQRIYSKLRLLGVLPPVSPDAHPGRVFGSAERLSELAASGNNGKPGPANSMTPEVAKHKPPQVYLQNEIPPDSPLGELLAQEIEPVAGAGDIWVRGARQHNLKNITVRIPRNKFVVITGVSGSGKSSLAFDTIYAEGQRRYVESLSSFARQFMDQMEKPQVDQISGLSPAIAIEQKTVSRNPRSTVGTVTEILDYLRVLFARAGIPHCPQCGRAVLPQSAQSITDQLSILPVGTRFQVLAPLARGRKGTFANTLAQATKDGYSRVRVDGEMFDLGGKLPVLDKNKKHSIELVVDRLAAPGSAEPVELQEFRARLMDSVETALRAGEGLLIINLAHNNEDILLSEHNACPVCELSFPELEPNLFSFNSPFGMCPECNGLGVVLQVDPDLIITRPDLSLLNGASRWWGDIKEKGEGSWSVRNLTSIAQHYGVDLELPWNQLPESFRHVLLHGSQGERIRFQYEHESDEGSWKAESQREVKGVIYHVNRLFRQTRSEGSRRYYMQYMNRLPCPTCHGERLCPEARFVTVGGRRLPELSLLNIADLHDWILNMPGKLDSEQQVIAGELVTEIRQRLGFIRNVGLHYLTLDRPAPTLSGGEGQRIRLASQISSGLVGVLYILDEPSIGLHTRDHRALLDTLQHLRDQGNTVMVVEHDAATMKAADWVIDLGPGPGILGGELVAEGTPDQLMANPASLTGRYLAGELQVGAGDGHSRRTAHGTLTVHNARLHNLKGIDVRFPLGVLVCVTGVSGSGKSSLISQTLYPALARSLNRAQTVPGQHDWIEGLDLLDKVVNITQEPIGRNPRSNPGTYVGVLDEIRKVFASTAEARALGFSAGRFSFNVKGGRCEACAGYGSRKVEMHFLPDVWVTCKECAGKRFNHHTLEITYKEKNIAEVLEMDVQQALEFFGAYPAIARILTTLHDVGLDYVKLGQSALTLSGGEAQRVKLAKELSAVATGKTLYILDEPTTGLHFADIQRLLDVLHRLVDAGNTVIVIEHNLDVIKTADWVIDLGPDGGAGGGKVVAEGSPEVVAAVPGSYTGKYLKEVLPISTAAI